MAHNLNSKGSQKLKKLLSVIVFTMVVFIIVATSYADKGVIAFTNTKCFVINTPSGYVLVDGYVNVPTGTTVIGKFNTFGSTEMFDDNGNELSGYIYIEDYGLSESRLNEKLADKCAP